MEEATHRYVLMHKETKKYRSNKIFTNKYGSFCRAIIYRTEYHARMKKNPDDIVLKVKISLPAEDIFLALLSN